MLGEIAQAVAVDSVAEDALGFDLVPVGHRDATHVVADAGDDEIPLIA